MTCRGGIRKTIMRPVVFAAAFLRFCEGADNSSKNSVSHTSQINNKEDLPDGGLVPWDHSEKLIQKSIADFQEYQQSKRQKLDDGTITLSGAATSSTSDKPYSSSTSDKPYSSHSIQGSTPYTAFMEQKLLRLNRANKTRNCEDNSSRTEFQRVLHKTSQSSLMDIKTRRQRNDLSSASNAAHENTHHAATDEVGTTANAPHQAVDPLRLLEDAEQEILRRRLQTKMDTSLVQTSVTLNAKRPNIYENFPPPMNQKRVFSPFVVSLAIMLFCIGLLAYNVEVGIGAVVQHRPEKVYENEFKDEERALEAEYYSFKY